jgi:hypothetical protein
VSPAWLPAIRPRQALIFLAVAVALLAPWPRLGRAFVPAFAAYGNLIAGTLDLPARPRFWPPVAGEATRADGGDWAVRVAPRDPGEGTLLDTRVLGYTPFAILVALVAALRTEARRRLLVLAGAAALLLARLGLAIALPLARAYDTPAGAAWAFGAPAELAWNVVVTPPASAYVAPLLAWWLALALTTPRAPAAARPARPSTSQTARAQRTSSRGRSDRAVRAGARHQRR